MRWSNVIIVAGISLPLLLLLAFGFGLDPREVPSVLPGKPAPNCTLGNPDGAPISIPALRGKPLVVNFWSTWCVPCEAEHQILQVAARRTDGNVQFLGVVYQDSPEAARDYLRRNGAAYPQASDPGSRCAIDFGVAGVPETFFVDAAGTILQKHVGPLTAQALADNLVALSRGVRP